MFVRRILVRTRACVLRMKKAHINAVVAKDMPASTVKVSCFLYFFKCTTIYKHVRISQNCDCELKMVTIRFITY